MTLAGLFPSPALVLFLVGGGLLDLEREVPFELVLYLLRLFAVRVARVCEREVDREREVPLLELLGLLLLRVRERDVDQRDVPLLELLGLLLLSRDARLRIGALPFLLGAGETERESERPRREFRGAGEREREDEYARLLLSDFLGGGERERDE